MILFLILVYLCMGIGFHNIYKLYTKTSFRLFILLYPIVLLICAVEGAEWFTEKK